jgi:hypothetical protein
MKKLASFLAACLLVLSGIQNFATAQPVVKISIGISQVNAIWQTSPPPFRQVSRWGGIGLSIVLWGVTLGVHVELVDFLTLRIPERPHFGITASIAIAQSAIATAYVSGGMAIYPFTPQWMSWSVRIGLSSSPIESLSIGGSLGIAMTNGAPAAGHPAGLAISSGIGISWDIASIVSQ